jgi:hypothetical protein
MKPSEAINFTIASIISAENEEFTEDVKQAVIKNLDGYKDSEKHDWKKILEPLGEDAYKYIEFLTALEGIDEDETFEK